MTAPNENEIKAQSWNECISPRLESLLGWYSGDEWSKGIAAHYRKVLETLQTALNNGQDSQRKEDIIRGRLLAIQEFLDMPNVIRGQIEKTNVQRPKPKGDAGY
jgi:hypothetical protein